MKRAHSPKAHKAKPRHTFHLPMQYKPIQKEKQPNEHSNPDAKSETQFLGLLEWLESTVEKAPNGPI